MLTDKHKKKLHDCKSATDFQCACTHADVETHTRLHDNTYDNNNINENDNNNSNNVFNKRFPTCDELGTCRTSSSRAACLEHQGLVMQECLRTDKNCPACT